MTGATGLVGGAFAAHLIDTVPRCELLLPVRSGKSPIDRVYASLRRFTAAPLEDRVRVCESLQPLERVTHVVHCAVDTSEHSRAVNVDGTLALARATLASRQLERFLYVGSAWSCGRSGEVHEIDTPSESPLFPYLADKLLAERMLGSLEGLPLQIVRPSLVMGHTLLGCEPSASLFWVLRLIQKLAHLPWHRAQRLDVVPLDWLCEALACLLFSRSTQGALHLSAGTASASWAQIEASLAHGRPWIAAPMDLDAWSSVAVAKVKGLSPMQATLLRCLRFFAGDTVFNNERMLASGVTPPPSVPSYLAACLRDDRSLMQQARDDA